MRYEYKIVTFSPTVNAGFGKMRNPTYSYDAVQASFNQLGLEGWELVNTHLDSTTSSNIAFFKRPLD